MRGFLREISVTLILAVVIFLSLQATVQSFIIIGSSMEPEFQEGQRLLINKVTYAFNEPERGDVIIFEPPNSTKSSYLIKRIIGLPGDTVEVKTGAVYVDGTKLEEPYIKDSPSYSLPPKKIPEDNYFVLGDNRNNSSDSHNGWTVPHKNVKGKAWISIWPPNEWGLVPDHSLME